MTEQTKLANWGSFIILKILEPSVRVATPLFIVSLMVYFIIVGFLEGVSVGVRQFAGALFPLLGITCVVVFNREMLNSLLRVPSWIIFCGSFVWGLLVLLLVGRIPGTGSIPTIEIVLSATLCVLVFTWIETIKNKVLLFYYGASMGLVLYIVVFGFPLL